MKESPRCRCSLFAFVCLMVLCSARPGFGLVISEIMYHPVEDLATGEEANEFIERKTGASP